MGKKEYDSSWFYRKRISTTIVVVLLIVLFLAANVTSGTRIRHDRACRKPLTMVHVSELIIPDQVEQTQQVISHGKGHHEIHSPGDQNPVYLQEKKCGKKRVRRKRLS